MSGKLPCDNWKGYKCRNAKSLEMAEKFVNIPVIAIRLSVQTNIRNLRGKCIVAVQRNEYPGRILSPGMLAKLGMSCLAFFV